MQSEMLVTLHFYFAELAFGLLLTSLGNNPTDQTKATNLQVCPRQEGRGGPNVTDQLWRGSITVIGNQSIQSRI